MIGRIIEYSAHHRVPVILAAMAAAVAGWWSMQHVPLDALPDLVRIVEDTEAALGVLEGWPPAESARAMRLELAKAQSVPPYVIFHDRTLAEMAARCPRSSAELAETPGVGAAKLARYGEAFLEIINGHDTSEDIARTGA